MVIFMRACKPSTDLEGVDGHGQVWRYDGDRNWADVTSSLNGLGNSVMVLEVMGDYLYAGTTRVDQYNVGHGRLFRYGGTAWQAYRWVPPSNPECGYSDPAIGSCASVGFR